MASELYKKCKSCKEIKLLEEFGHGYIKDLCEDCIEKIVAKDHIEVNGWFA